MLLCIICVCAYLQLPVPRMQKNSKRKADNKVEPVAHLYFGGNTYLNNTGASQANSDTLQFIKVNQIQVFVCHI